MLVDFVNKNHVDPLEQKVFALQELKRRIQTRLSTLRKSQVAIMIERNLYLSKLREVENYGRDQDWGRSDDDTDGKDAGQEHGQELLHSIYDVLYDASKDKDNVPSQ